MRYNIVVLTQVLAVFALCAAGQSPENSTDGKAHSKVLIIGAGPSGVAAASRLMANGVDVTLLEAEHRLGGRIHTVPFGRDPGAVVDLGAQWVHGANGNVVYAMAKPLGLLEEHDDDFIGPLENSRFVLGNGTVPDQEMLFHLTWVTNEFGEDGDALRNFTGSYGQFMTERFTEYISDPANNVTAPPAMTDTFIKWFERLSAFADGADSWFNISAKELNDYQECEGDQGINWINNGYYSVIDLLTKKFPNPAEELPVRNKTRFGTEVKTIHWGLKNSSEAVEVETSDGERYTADIVLVTVSLGVLKENASTMFDPPLNEKKMNAIKNIGFGQVNKIMLHFKDWWLSNFEGLNFLVTDADRQKFNAQYPQYSEQGEWLHGLTGFYAYPRQPHAVLAAWLVGDPARNMEKYSDSDVMTGCMRWMEMFTNKSLPMPVEVARSKWYSNPHFRGSYSHRSLDSEHFKAQPSHLAEPLTSQEGTPKVLFAGEATNDHHFSTVHGAIETGWREADRILNILKKQ